MLRNLFFLSVVFVIGACTHTAPKMPSRAHQVQKSVSIGEDLMVSRYSDIHFSPQPTEKDFDKLKSQGFTHVVNLRGSDEYDESQEKKKVESLKMNYTQIPIHPNEQLAKNTVNMVTQSVMAHRKKGKTLIHCSTGQRAAYWAGAHFYLDHGQSAEEALQTARDLGLKHPKLTEKLKVFLRENPQSK